jgi:hypothetical protein
VRARLVASRGLQLYAVVYRAMCVGSRASRVRKVGRASPAYIALSRHHPGP